MCTCQTELQCYIGSVLQNRWWWAMVDGGECHGGRPCRNQLLGWNKVTSWIMCLCVGGWRCFVGVGAVTLGFALASAKTHRKDRTWHQAGSIREGACGEVATRTSTSITNHLGRLPTTARVCFVYLFPTFLPNHCPVPERHRCPSEWVSPSSFSQCR